MKVPLDTIPENIKPALKKILNAAKEKGIEHAAAILPNGKIISEEHGDEGSVAIDWFQLRRLCAANKAKITFAHTHPSGGSFSGQDLAAMCENELIKEMRVVGSNGRTYVMAVQDGERPRSDTIIREHEDLSFDYLVRDMKSDQDKEKLAEDIVSAVNKALAEKYGWVYKEGRLDD